MSPFRPLTAVLARPFPGTVGMVCIAAVAAHFSEAWLDAQSLALFFVVPIVLAAMNYGARAALAGGLLSVAAINFLFVQPRYTLAVTRVQDLGALFLFVIVSLLVSLVAGRARQAGAAQLEASRERFKAELLSGVSHDLRTPLSTILFTLQSLQRFPVHSPAERAELVDLAEAEARRLSGLVETLLSAARVEAGASPVRIEAANVGDIAAAALEELKTDLAGRDVTSTVREDLPLVAADTALAVRALANVVANAARHGQPGAVTLSARCVAHHVLLEVADRGPGLGANPERLFEKFVRGIGGDGRPPGLGLGLSLARGFMESQGGTLSAANREGGGAVFTLSFACWTQRMTHDS